MAKQTSTASELATLIMRLTRLVRAPAHVSDFNPAQWDALRYLGSANRFSRYPAELTAYLGSTKGTVSQTLMSLEAKGLLTKQRDSDNARRVHLDLTKDGKQVLRGDPVKALERMAKKMPAKHSEDALKALSSLADSLAGKAATVFGTCAGCKHFNKASGKKAPNCGLFDATLSVSEASQLCAYYSGK